jgi:hypothetical protein
MLIDPILLLDEASQMVEPASIVPLVRFKAERLLVVGGEWADVRQLHNAYSCMNVVNEMNSPLLLLFVQIHSSYLLLFLVTKKEGNYALNELEVVMR